MTSYSAAWFKGMDDEEKKKFTHILESNTILLDKLTEIVYNIVKEAEDVSSKDYDSPSWAYKQAHRNGVADAARKILSLVKRDG